jgi:hypothetical protein
MIDYETEIETKETEQMSFLALKKRKAEGVEKLVDKINANQKGKSYDRDTRYWQPLPDKAGNGNAIIRFLPEFGDEELPYVKMYNYSFKERGLWYIENSPTTIGEKDPVKEFTDALWASDDESQKDIARKYKRRTKYIVNILVVKHDARPEDEGKVFLWSFGKKIFDKIFDKMTPAESDIEPMNAFNPWTGANFRLRLRKVEGYNNYDKSEFDPPKALGTDEEIEAVYSQQYSLQAEVSPDKFKSFDALKRRFYQVLGESVEETAPAATTTPETKEEEAPWVESPTTAPAEEAAAGDEDGDELAYFKKMAAAKKAKK